MPYYREHYLNKSVTGVRTPASGVSVNYPMPLDQTVLTGWRSISPPRSATSAREIADTSADPYAYFLGHETKRKYQARLTERGLEAQGDSDRGHSFQLCTYKLEGKLYSGRYVSKSLGLPETFVDHANMIIRPTDAALGLGSGDDPPLMPRRLPNMSGLDSFAQLAYSRSAPTAVVFDAAQFLGELREGLPRLSSDLIKSGTKAYKGVGSDYLNVEFGWKPFINDLIKAGQALAGATNLLRNSNTRVHRTYGVPPVQTTYQKSFAGAGTSVMLPNYSVESGPFGTPYTAIGASTGPDNVGSYFLRTMEQRRWFEGEFTNFMPLGFDPTDYFQRLNQLVNVSLTPSVLWELSPWSWLVDWYLRIGDTIKSNELAANDRLVMHYGYAMEKTVFKDLLSLDMSAVPRNPPGGTSYRYWPGLPTHHSLLATTTYKRRIRANPYGFKLGGTSALSIGQLGILGALGLTRLK